MKNLPINVKNLTPRIALCADLGLEFDGTKFSKMALGKGKIRGALYKDNIKMFLGRGKIFVSYMKYIAK